MWPQGVWGRGVGSSCACTVNASKIDQEQRTPLTGRLASTGRPSGLPVCTPWRSPGSSGRRSRRFGSCAAPRRSARPRPAARCAALSTWRCRGGKGGGGGRAVAAGQASCEKAGSCRHADRCPAPALSLHPHRSCASLCCPETPTLASHLEPFPLFRNQPILTVHLTSLLLPHSHTSAHLCLKPVCTPRREQTASSASSYLGWAKSGRP